jgi:hypothetical protein
MKENMGKDRKKNRQQIRKENSQNDLRRTSRRTDRRTDIRIGRGKDKKENMKKGGTGKKTYWKTETGRTGAGGQAVGQAGD